MQPIWYLADMCLDSMSTKDCCHIYTFWVYLDRVKRIWYLSPMRAAKVQASLRIRAVSPEPSLLALTSSESRGTFRQKARSLAPLNGWACAVKICHDGMLEDTNSLDGAHLWKYECFCLKWPYLESPEFKQSYRNDPKFSDTQKICCNHSKVWTVWLYHRVMSPNDADGMANSVDPDQTAPLGAVWSGSALFAQAYLSENLGSLQYIPNPVRYFIQFFRIVCTYWLKAEIIKVPKFAFSRVGLQGLVNNTHLFCCLFVCVEA